MIGDVLNEDSGFYLSFLASLWDFDVFSDERWVLSPQPSSVPTTGNITVIPNRNL